MGLSLSTYTFEDKHLELAADTTTVLHAAGVAVGEFYGRRTDAYLKTCTDMSIFELKFRPSDRH